MSFSFAGRPGEKRKNAGTVDVAAHYDSLCDAEKHKKRSASLAFGVRRCNNALKRELLQTYVPAPVEGGKGPVLLDLCCGRGGDLDKWRTVLSGDARVLGVDVSLDSVAEARRRRDEARRQGKPDLPACVFLRGDAASPALWQSVDRLAKGLSQADQWPSVDVVTCHFAAHYMWATRKSADDFLRNATCRLRPGGVFICTVVREATLRERFASSCADAAVGVGAATAGAFGNALYKVDFCASVGGAKRNSVAHVAAQLARHADGEHAPLSYEFSLVDSVDRCVEWVVPRKHFLQAAARHGLRPILCDESFEGISAGARANVERLTQSEREVVSLYGAYVFCKEPAAMEKK